MKTYGVEILERWFLIEMISINEILSLRLLY